MKSFIILLLDIIYKTLKMSFEFSKINNKYIKLI